MDKIKSIGEGTTFSEISKSKLEKVSLTLPKIIEEQQKIANILLKIDNAIEKTKE
ncbi:MAG: restriction endonuclease subunit S, partial [Asgard group archaeon]|nr:restriction endonuclease subunit S [Asgard group archaeon]